MSRQTLSRNELPHMPTRAALGTPKVPAPTLLAQAPVRAASPTTAGNRDSSSLLSGRGLQVSSIGLPGQAAPVASARRLPGGVTEKEYRMMKNVLFNEANGQPLQEMAKVAQATMNYAQRKGVSVERIIMGGRMKGAIPERYLYDDPRHIKKGGEAQFKAQEQKIEAALEMGLNREVPGFSKTFAHWRGRGGRNRFFE